MERVADVCLGVAWVVVIAHSVLLAAGEPRRQPPSLRLIAGLVTVAVTAGLAVLLEQRTGGRFATSPLLAAVGTIVTLAGAAAHIHTRTLVGATWSSAPAPVATTLRDDGPYARVRHPLYAAIVAMLVGTVLAHPSVATACAIVGMGVGLALKIRREERELRAAFGAKWHDYRARVPCLLPRFDRCGTGARR